MENIELKKKYLFELFNYLTESNNTHTLQNIANNVKQIISNNKYKNILNLFNIRFTENFIIFCTKNISDNLQHSNKLCNFVQNLVKCCVFDKNTYYPLFYLDKNINSKLFEDNNSFISKNINYNIDLFKRKLFDNKITIYENFIGNKIIVFYHIDKWYFFYKNNIYELTKENHLILFHHINCFLNRMNKDICYYFILNDTRIKKLISNNNNNYLILIKTTKKYTLEEIDTKDIFFVPNNRIFLSCYDEMEFYLEELNNININNKKIIKKGIIVKIIINDDNELYVNYNTHTYNNILDLIPKYNNYNKIYLNLYQNDKLNYVLKFINDSYTDIIKRINVSMSTMSREILDIYHMTRNKNNSELYNILPNNYKKLLYQLHSDYILQKNTINNFTKISIGVNDVYNKLKKLDTSMLINLYLERDVLINMSINKNNILFPIKSCINTKIQSKLLTL
jgi:hypothetical protein